MRKDNQGITLIALVITIIVLLILAGVSIAMLTGGNGLLSKAVESRVENARGEVCDRINTAINAAYAELLAARFGAGKGLETTDKADFENVSGFTELNGKPNAIGQYDVTISEDNGEENCEIISITWTATNKEYGSDIVGKIVRSKAKEDCNQNEVPYKVEPALTGSGVGEATD